MKNAATTLWVATANRLKELRDRGAERGLTTTEVAILTFLLITVAIGLGTIIFSYVSDRGEEINNIEPPTFGP